MTWWKYFAGLLAIYLSSKFFEFRRNVRKLSNLPGLRPVFSPISALGPLIPTCSWNPGFSWQWKWRNQVHSKYGVQTMSVIPYLSGTPCIYTCSMDVARQIVSVKGQFEKPEQGSAFVRPWGRNVFTENGAEWSRHRRIINPAFTPRTYELVWTEATALYQEMVQGEGLNLEEEKTISDVRDLTAKFALLVIARCGFGQSVSWNTPPQASGISFPEALAIVSASAIARLVIPRWMYKLPIKRLRDIETAYTDLEVFTTALIQTRREELATEQTRDDQKKDVFRLLLRANEGEEKLRLSDSELTGNTFLMLFAGHETTAKTLDATIGFLALYENVQAEVYEEISALTGADGRLNFKDYPQLVKVQCCFLEAARLFPSVFMMLRETTEVVTIKTEEQDGHGGQLIVEPGTTLAVDMVALHYNAKYFDNPEEFRPSRWYGVSESDMTMFSVGPRACVGRRFALVEGVVFLSNFLRDFQVHIILNPGETRAEWRTRVMTSVTALTLGVGKVPVRLTRR